MLIVVIFGFTSCNKSTDEAINRLISGESEKQQYTPTPSISVTTDTTTARERPPLINDSALSKAIKDLISTALMEYPNNFFGMDEITLVRALLYSAARSYDLALMTAIKNALLNPPHTAGKAKCDDIVAQLLAIKKDDLANKYDRFKDSISKNEVQIMIEIQSFCDIVDFFYNIESIRRDILNTSYDDSNFNTLADQLNTVYNMASAINASQTCGLDNKDFVIQLLIF
jgi:hypothetical protein